MALVPNLGPKTVLENTMKEVIDVMALHETDGIRTRLRGRYKHFDDVKNES